MLCGALQPTCRPLSILSSNLYTITISNDDVLYHTVQVANAGSNHE
jgi:hypothetical protein